MERALPKGLASRVFGPSPERALLLLRAAWPSLVGHELARRTEPVALEGNALRIRVPDAGWRKVLLRMRGQILARLRDVAGDLAPRRLSFSEGVAAGSGVAAPSSAAPAVPAAATQTLAPTSLTAQAGAIQDPEIRRRFLDVAGRYLERFQPKPAGQDRAFSR